MAKKMTLASLLGVKPQKKRVRRCWACGLPVPRGTAKKAPAKKPSPRTPTGPAGWEKAYADVNRRRR